MSRVRALLASAELPDRFERWHLSLAAGEDRPASSAEWSGALVLVDRGTVEIECAGGCRQRFGRGDLLALGGLALRRLRNPGRREARLIAVRRRAARKRVGSDR